MSGSGGDSGSGGQGNSIFDPPAENIDPKVLQDIQELEDTYIGSISFDPLSLGTRALPERPGFNDVGSRELIRANYNHISLSADKTLYKCIIEIQPKVLGLKAGRVIELMFDQYKNTFGNKTCWTDFRANLVFRKRPDEDSKFNVRYYPEHKDEPDKESPVYHVRVRDLKKLEIRQFLDHLESPRAAPYQDKEEMINALQTIFLHHARSSKNLVVNRQSVFPLDGPAKQVRYLGGNVELWRGFTLSVRPATGRVLANIDMTYSPMYRSDILGSLMSTMRFRNAEDFLKHFKGLRVELSYRKRTNKQGQGVAPQKTVYGVAQPGDGIPYKSSKQPESRPPRVRLIGAGAKDVEFWQESKQSYISVYDYFTGLGIGLKSPSMAVINVGTHDYPVYVPPELCTVKPGQTVRLANLSSGQHRNMIQLTKHNPGQKFRTIYNFGLNIVGLSPETNTLIKDNSDLIQTSKHLLKVPARPVSKPSLKYKGLQEVKTTTSAWNLLGQQLSGSPGEKSWVCIYVGTAHQCRGSSQPENFKTTMSRFQTSMRSYGIKLGNPKTFDGDAKILDLGEWDDPKLEAFLNSINVDLVWVIVPAQSTLLYDRIKQLGDVKKGLTTVVSVDKKLSKPENELRQYFGNQALKVNLKLGGSNQVLLPSSPTSHFLSQSETMVVGIDVIHPSTDQRNRGVPSVAGMVASVDGATLAQWLPVLRVQEAGQEIVVHLEEMLITRLKAWKQRRGSLPENILVYRDGVSEGQHKLVNRDELPQLQAACAAVYPTDSQKSPRITIVIVAKRHRTRFAPTDAQRADKTFNCEAGFVVDRGITEAASWNFYLQAHAAIQGAARPALYTVVHDEIFRSYASSDLNKLKRNPAVVAHEVTHSLCYVFGRATRAVSICTPAYYADILCNRAGCYLRVLAARGLFSGNNRPSLDQMQAEIKTHARLEGTMFYI